jgi:hypothetical protein
MPFLFLEKTSQNENFDFADLISIFYVCRSVCGKSPAHRRYYREAGQGDEEWFLFHELMNGKGKTRAVIALLKQKNIAFLILKKELTLVIVLHFTAGGTKENKSAPGP